MISLMRVAGMRRARNYSRKISPGALDWAIVLLFYSALHQVEAYFATKGRHSKDHKQRDSSVPTDPNTRPIYRAYGRMKIDSLNARYFAISFNSQTVAKNKANLHTIKAHLARFL
jgi:hypothetical protein